VVAPQSKGSKQHRRDHDLGGGDASKLLNHGVGESIYYERVDKKGEHGHVGEVAGEHGVIVALRHRVHAEAEVVEVAIHFTLRPEEVGEVEEGVEEDDPGGQVVTRKGS